MAIRCPICRGTKKCISLGNLLKDCKACQGIGFVNDDVKTDKQNEVMANGKADGKAERKAK